MSATSSGSGNRDDAGAMSSSTKEIGEGTEGKVDNACNSQTHSTPHRAQCETNHTSIPAHTHSTDETHQDGASCHGDKGAKLGVQKNGLTSMAEKGSNSEQKCKGKSSYTEVVGTQSGRNEDSESSVEDEDQSEDVKSLGGKGGKRVKTCSITRSDTDARDHRDEAVQEGEKITLDENHRGKSDCNSLPKGNEQKNKSDGAIPGVKDEKPDHKSGCNDTEKSPSVNESNIDDVAMQEAKIENHDQNSELKHTSKRPVGNENDIDEGAMQRARDEKHDQNNGNKDIDNRPGRNEKDTDNKIRPSVENENNGDGDTEERPMKYEKNDKGDITTEAVKEESPDVNKKINNTKKEFRENEKKDHPYNGTTKDQDDKTKSISQARNLELSDKTASVLGDPDKPFDDSDGGTKESEDKGALPETTPLTQTAQPCNQMDYYACHQDEVGATHSEASHETSSSSQSQDDYTILDKQLDGLINEIFTESNLKESIEERKKSAREKLKSFFLAKVMDGSLSQRSHYPCATKSMPLQIFDSDIHITETLTGHAKGAMQGGGAEGGPSSSQHKLRYDPSKYATKQHEESIDIGVEKNHQEPSRQTGEKVDVKSIHGKTRSTPNPEAGKPPLPQSPKIPAETNRKDARAARREQNVRDKPSSSPHNQANDPTDPSKCTTDPDVEIPFTDSEENRQGPPEQSTPQTKGAISLHGKTSRAPNPKAGDSHFSKSCSSTEKTSSTPNPEAGKPPLPQSPNIPAEINRKDARAVRREQNARDKPSSSQHNQANDPTDPSKCTTDPDVEIPFIDSEENRQEPQEQSTLQTKGAVSLHGKTSRDPNPKAGDSHFSKSCSSTESSSQTGKQDTTAIHLNSSLSAASSSRVSSAPTSQIDMDFKKNAKGVKTESLRSSTAGSSKRPSSEDPDNLYIQWNTEPKTEGNKNFEIHVLCNHSSKSITNIQIVCKPADFYRLKFLFDKKSKDLMNNLSAMGYTVYIRDQEIFLGSGTVKNPELIRNDIEAAIIRMKDFSRIVVHSAVTSFADERLVDKCEVLSSEFKEGNIAMYLDHLSVWIVGRDGDKLKVLETELMEERLLLKENIIDLTETLYFTEDHQGMKNENTVHLDNPSGMPFVESHFASDTELSQKEDTKEVRKHNYFFVVEAETRLKDEERELQVECSPTEYLKLLFIFSNETLKMKAEEKFRSFKIILCEKYSMRLEKTCMCIKPKGRTKLDGLFIDDVLSACKSLFPLVHIKKMVMDPSTCIEEIKTYCYSWHDAYKEKKVQLFQKRGSDKVWVAIEHEILDFGNEVIKDLISNNFATECPLEQKNHKLIAYFVQSAVLKDKDLRLFKLLNMLKKNKYLADKYEGMNVSEKEKWVIISGHKEIHENLFEKMMTQSGSVPPSLNELLNNHEVLEFIFQNFQTKHPSEPMCWMVAEQSGKSFIEAYALKSSAINVFETILHCFKEIRFEYACLQKDAFLLPVLKGDKFRGKIGIMDTENFVKITGTVDVFEEYIDLLQKESDRLKKPVCKTIGMNSINILRFCETYHQDSLRKWKKIVDIEPIVRDGKCCYTIKGSPKHQGIVEEIENELQKLLTSIVVKEVVSKEEMINMDLSRNQELRKKRCEIEREWSVDTVFESVPGQDWSVEDGFEWHFQNGQSFTILTLKSGLPVETDVVLHPCPMANIKVGTHQTDTDNYSNRDWHCLKFEVEHKDIGKAKDTLRESLKTTLLTKVKGNHFQNIVFPLDQKTMERIGWSITHYLKQIVYAVHEGCRSEPWSIFFLCATKDEFEACVKILKKHFEDSKSSMSSLKIKTFPIEENLTPAITIEIKQGSLVETEADVIVNTTEKSLRRLQYGQISKSILFAAGDELSKECVKKYSKGVGYSEVAVTPSFQLKLCKKIYHGGIPTYKGTLEPLTKFVWNCLLQATKDKMKSIAFPAIGTGNLMYPIESVADAMMSTVEKFRDEQSTTLISVFFVIFDTGTLQKFRERNSSKQTAAGTETPSMKITVIGNSDGAENASLCLREFINDLKKKKEDVNVTKPAELQQPTLEGNKGQGKSKEIVDDQRRTILSETIHKRENISDDRISLGLILVKKALDTDSSLDVEECRRHLNEFKYKNIICPFGKKFQALVKFETMEDTDRVLKNFKSASFKIEKLPHQAVNNIKAKLSREIVNYLKASDFQEEEVENETGAHLDKNEWIITGTLLEIKQAEEFLRMKICKNAESKGQNSNTCLPKGIPDASAVDASAKKTLRCSISDWEAVKFFFKDVISKFYSKPDLDDSCCVVSGNQEAINEFSHSLKSLFKRTLTNIGQDDLKLGTKSKSVYYYFAKKENRLIMYAKSEEILKAAEDLFKSQARKGERRSDEVLDEENQNLPQKTYPSTTDNNDALNDEYYEMEADDFNTVCHFYKELTTGFKERCVGSKVHLKGPKDQVENLKFALQEITQKFYTVEIERDGREQSKIYDIYAQMMQVEHSIHTRVKMRGSKIAVLFTGKEKESVADLKSWFEVELKNKTKTSGKKMATYQKKSSLYENCLIFEEKQLKVYAIEKDILEVSSAAIVCPYPLHVGQYIRKKLGVESGIADYIGLLGLDEIKVIPVDTSSSKLTLLHTSVPYWTKYYKKDNPSDDCIQDIQSIIENCLSAGEIYKTLSIPVFYSDRLCQLPDMIWCTAVERALRNYSKIRKGSNEMNIYMVDKKPEKIQALKRFFTEGINWSFVSNETFSVFYFGSTFQLHVKKADIFGAEADALAVPQDPGMKNERFIAKQLSKLEDKSYQSAIKRLKSLKPPTVTVAPFQLCFSKVIHYVSPNWNNKNKNREALLKDHYLSMKTLLDAASSHCASVVIPLSGGQNTNEETRKEIAKSTAAAVADWFKENSKKLNILKTIYFENDDTKNIKFLIECFERKLQPSCFVERPKLSSAV